MEEQIIKNGINAKCKAFVMGEWWNARVVMINTYNKSVGVIIEVDNGYISLRYDQIKFEE